MLTFLEQDKFLQKDRAEARTSKGRIAYDCFNAVLNGDRVGCLTGRPLWPTTKDRCANLFFIERGGLPSACVKCPEYDNGGLEPL